MVTQSASACVEGAVYRRRKTPPRCTRHVRAPPADRRDRDIRMAPSTKRKLLPVNASLSNATVRANVGTTTAPVAGMLAHPSTRQSRKPSQNVTGSTDGYGRKMVRGTTTKMVTTTASERAAAATASSASNGLGCELVDRECAVKVAAPTSVSHVVHGTFPLQHTNSVAPTADGTRSSHRMRPPPPSSRRLSARDRSTQVATMGRSAREATYMSM